MLTRGSSRSNRTGISSRREASRPGSPKSAAGLYTNVYKAFISYSHSVDGRLAPALQDALQRFTKPWYRRRALRVFRDEANLGANPALWSSIQAALDCSEFFVLLASPEAARSVWVEREVKYWLARKTDVNFLIVLTDGDIVWDENTADFDWNETTALPPSLRGFFKEEPRYVDFRWARTIHQLSLGYPEFRSRVADLAAPLYGRSKDDLVGEDIRAHRRTLAVVRGAIAVLTALLLAVGCLAWLFVGQRNAVRVQRDLAQLAARTAESRALAAEARLSLGRQPALALLQGLQALKQADTVEAEGSLLSALQYDPRIASYLPVGAPATSVAFSPDGRLLASGADNNTVVIWDVRRREPLGEPLRGHGKAVTSVAFSSDRKLLAIASNDNTVILWDLQRRRPIGTPLVGHNGAVTSVSFSPDGRVLASGSGDGTIRLWDSSRHEPLGRAMVNNTFTVDSLAFSPDGAMLAAGGLDAVVLWDVRTRRPARRLAVRLAVGGGVGATADAVAFSPDGANLAAGMSNGVVELWDRGWRGQLIEPARQLIEPASSGAPAAVAFSPDGRSLAAAQQRTITIWDIRRRRAATKPLVGHLDVVTGVAFSPDGKTLASASEDQTVILDDVADLTYGPSLGSPLRGDIGVVTGAAAAPDGRSLAVGDVDAVTLWDIGRRRLIVRFQVHDGYAVFDDGYINGMAFNPDGRLLALREESSKVWLWDIALHEASGQPFIVSGNRVTSVAFSPDGRLLASGSEDGVVHVWNVRSREVIAQLHRDGAGGISSLAFSPDGKAIVAGTEMGYVEIWDVLNRRLVGEPFTDQTLAVTSVVVSPDGTTVVSASSDGTIVAWKFQDHSRLGQFLGDGVGSIATGKDGSGVGSITIDKDGRILASGGEDGGIRLWDFRSRRLIGVLTGHSRPVKNVSFYHSGSGLISVGSDDRILLWEVGIEPWRARACKIIEPLAGASSGLSLSGAEYDGLCS